MFGVDKIQLLGECLERNGISENGKEKMDSPDTHSEVLKNSIPMRSIRVAQQTLVYIVS